jgi:Tol biopolymer transport system component
MNLADGTSRRLGGPVATGRAGGAPVWSPDSTRVAFPGSGSTSPPSRDVWIADADGAETIRVIRHPGDDSVVAWSPDGRLASTSEEGIAVYQPDGSGRTIIYDKPMGDPGLLRWSPDGTKVAAIPGGWYVSVIARADGGGYIELHHYYSGHGITGDFSATEVDWAPTSDRLILAGRTPDPDRAPAWRVVKADGTALWTEPTAPWPAPDWAPAGEVIASLRDGKIQLYDAKTGAHTGIFPSMPSGLTVRNYTWMPDGTAIAFTAAAG